MTQEELTEKFQRENLTLAPILSRIAAFIIDRFILSFLLFLVYFQQFEQAITIEQKIIFSNTLAQPLILLIIIYQSFFVWMYGATPGKMLLKIKVVNVDLLDNPNITMSFLRACIRTFSEFILYLGFFWAFLNPARETWHDKFSRTLVINA